MGAAIESILAQSFREFELLIIDDGSSDSTPDELAKFTDPRIRHIRQENRGLAATLNAGIDLARGKYIARQDADDISLPDRITKQVDYMESHPECGILGTWAQIIEHESLVERYHKHPGEISEIRNQLLLNNPFVHSSMMIRKSVLDKTGVYTTDPNRQPPEDYELWSRIIRVTSGSNLQEVLVFYRETPGSICRSGPAPFRKQLVKICAENIAWEAKMSPNDSDITAIAAITHGAHELVIQKPDFNRMREILLSAVDNIATGETKTALIDETTRRVTALRGLHLANHTFLGRLATSQVAARSILKRLFRLYEGVLKK